MCVQWRRRALALAQVLGIMALGSPWGSAAEAQATRELTRTGIIFSVPAFAEVVERSDGGGLQTYVRVEGSDVFARVSRGGELAADPVGLSTPTTMCGRPAQRFEIHTPELRAVASYLDEEGRVHHREPEVRPARVDVVVTFTRRGGARVRVDWSVRADLRDRHRAQEEAFFDSVRCAP